MDVPGKSAGELLVEAACARFALAEKSTEVLHKHSGVKTALLCCLCGCSEQNYFHSKCVIAGNRRELGGAAGAAWTIKGNASALHMVWRGRVRVPGRRGCCARHGPEGRHLHENQSRRKYLRESGWVGGWVVSREWERDKRGCVGLCVRGLQREMRGRMSVGGREKDAAPSLCCQTEHSIPDALTTFSTPPTTLLFYPVNSISNVLV